MTIINDSMGIQCFKPQGLNCILKTLNISRCFLLNIHILEKPSL